MLTGKGFYSQLSLFKPMRGMANLEYTYIVQELQPLVGRRLDKFYELGPGRFRLKFGKDHLLIVLGQRLHLTKYLEEAGEPRGFAQKVRKELKGKKLSSLMQKGKDRIVVLDFSGKKLIAEMFGSGNLVLVEGGKISAVYERRSWRDRELFPGKEYSFPPSSEKTLDEVLAGGGGKKVAAALVPLNIGIDYVKKVLSAAGIDEKKPVGELSPKEIISLRAAYKELLAGLKPVVLEEAAGYTLYGEGEPKESLSEAVDGAFGPPSGEEEEDEGEKKRLALLKQQEERLVELAREEKEAKAKGDLIYEKYSEVEEVLQLYREGGLAAVERLAKEKGWKLDKRKKELEMDL